MPYINANGDLVPWDALNEAEQSFYVAPLAEETVEHIVAFWREVTLTELYFQDPWYCPDEA